MIRGIAACDYDWGIGKNGTLPWPKNKADLQWFKFITSDCIVVMGSNTWHDPLMPKPLKNRYNIVVTDTKLIDQDPSPHATVSRDAAQKLLLSLDKDVWVIGGARLFTELLPIIEEFWITGIKGHYDCDVKMPNLIEKGYRISRTIAIPNKVTVDIYR